MSAEKQKLLSSVLTAAVSFLGLESLSFIIGKTYQLGSYDLVAVYLYLFQLLWLTFIFDLHLKKRDILLEVRKHHVGFKVFRQALKERLSHLRNWYFLRHYINFFILPGVIYWSAVILIRLNPFDEVLKQALVILSAFALVVVYWYLKEFYNKNFELHHFGTKLLALAKLFAAFLAYSAILGYSFYFGKSAVFACFWFFVVTFLLVYQALLQRRLFRPKLLPAILSLSLAVCLVGFWIYNIWNHDYLTGSLLILAVYNTCWGILHHFLDNNLTKKLAWEYLIMMALIVSILLASHDFMPRVQ